jgi:hypothetical protein
MEYKQIRSIFSPKISETIIIPVNQDTIVYSEKCILKIAMIYEFILILQFVNCILSLVVLWCYQFQRLCSVTGRPGGEEMIGRKVMVQTRQYSGICLEGLRKLMKTLRLPGAQVRLSVKYIQ